MDKLKTIGDKVFLGGTCAGSTWRDELIPKLEIEYFNPVVDDWTEAAQEEELKQREECSHCLYVLTPLMQGVYSVAEVVDDSNKRPDRVLLCILQTDIDEYGDKAVWSKQNAKSLKMLEKMVEDNGAKVARDLNEVAQILNDAE